MIFSWILERDARLYARASSAYHGHLEERKRQEMYSEDNHIERTKRMIEVMQAYVDGKEIEFKSNSIGAWKKTKKPGWYWNGWDYRIAETADSINWDHVAPEFKYMERRPTGEAYLYTGHPGKSNTLRSMPASVFSSYRKGTCDWKNSLVIRPGCE